MIRKMRGVHTKPWNHTSYSPKVTSVGGIRIGSARYDDTRWENVLPVIKRSLRNYFKMNPQLSQEDREDLYQEACLGALKAIEKFSPHGGASFKHYAVIWITKYIIECLYKFVQRGFSAVGIRELTMISQEFKEARPKVFPFYDECESIDTGRTLEDLMEHLGEPLPVVMATNRMPNSFGAGSSANFRKRFMISLRARELGLSDSHGSIAKSIGCSKSALSNVLYGKSNGNPVFQATVQRIYGMTAAEARARQHTTEIELEAE